MHLAHQDTTINRLLIGAAETETLGRSLLAQGEAFDRWTLMEGKAGRPAIAASSAKIGQFRVEVDRLLR